MNVEGDETEEKVKVWPPWPWPPWGDDDDEEDEPTAIGTGFSPPRYQQSEDGYDMHDHDDDDEEIDNNVYDDDENYDYKNRFWLWN